MPPIAYFVLFLFAVRGTNEIYTLSLHDALPIFRRAAPDVAAGVEAQVRGLLRQEREVPRPPARHVERLPVHRAAGRLPADDAPRVYRAGQVDIDAERSADARDGAVGVLPALQNRVRAGRDAERHREDRLHAIHADQRGRLRLRFLRHAADAVVGADLRDRQPQRQGRLSVRQWPVPGNLRDEWRSAMAVLEW